MHRKLVAIAGAALVTLPLLGGPAQAAPDRTQTVAAGAISEWTGSTQAGKTNYNYWGVAPQASGVLPVETCTKDAQSYCEQILVKFDNPLSAAEIAAGKKSKVRNATVTIDGFAVQGPVNDFDLLAYESDAAGTKGARLASDGDLTNTTQEQVSFSVETTPTESSVYVLIHVVYYQVISSGYHGKVDFN